VEEEYSDVYSEILGSCWMGGGDGKERRGEEDRER